MFKKVSILILSLILALSMFPSVLMADEVPAFDPSITEAITEAAEEAIDAEGGLTDIIDETETIIDPKDETETITDSKDATQDDPDIISEAEQETAGIETEPAGQEPVISIQEDDTSEVKTEDGLYLEDGTWKYFEQNLFKEVTGLVKRVDNGKWYYVQDGIFTKATGLVTRLSDNVLCYVENGVFKKSTGVAARISSGKYYYVKKGIYTKETGLAKSLFDSNWYYVKKGKFSETTLLAQKKDSTSKKWFYVKDGVMQSKVAKPVAKAKKWGANSSHLMVSWKKVPGANGYYVYRAASKNGKFKLVNITETACKFLDSQLSSGTTYYYKVRAYVGKPLKANGTRTFVSSSEIVKATTASTARRFYYTDTSVGRTSSNTVTVTDSKKASAKKIIAKLEKGKNFYLYVKTGASLSKLKKQVRKLNDMGIGFESIGSYGGAAGRYYLIDAQMYVLINKYIKMAYKERMAEYKIYLDSGMKKDYFYTHKNETTKKKDFIANYRDSMFECAYGTPFKDMSTESKLLFITPGTNMTVRTNYMAFNFTYNVGENAYDIIYKMTDKSAEGVCRHYALALQTICDYLGIPCWQPVDWGYNHQWGFVKTTSEAGKTVWYTMDNENVHITPNENALRHERLGEYVTAVKNALGSAYPF